MKIPDRNECLTLLAREKVPAHIITHSLRVAQVAVFLTKHLNRCGANLSLVLVEAGALLHDITKMSSLVNGGNHAESGARFLNSLGYGEVAEIVRQHIVLDPRPLTEPLVEPQIVYYADKRVQHDCIVLLADRVADIIARYGHNKEWARRMAPLNEHIQALEARFFLGLPFDPAFLNHLNKQSLE